MAYINLTGVFGAARANLPVTIVEYSTGIPAIILSSATGGLVSTQGDTFLDSSGNLSVWVESGKSWSVSVDEGAPSGPLGLLTSAQIGMGAVGVLGLTSGGSIVGPTGSLITLVEVTPYVNLTSTGTAFTGACELAGYDCTVAAGNITIYDGTNTSGTVIVPTTSLAVGRVEFGYKRALGVGCHVVLSGAATVNVLVG